jgi:hypothetical protein
MSSNWNWSHTTLIIQTKLVQDFIQTSIEYSEALLQHCSCYSNPQRCHIDIVGVTLWESHQKGFLKLKCFSSLKILTSPFI